MTDLTPTQVQELQRLVRLELRLRRHVWYSLVGIGLAVWSLLQ